MEWERPQKALAQRMVLQALASAKEARAFETALVALLQSLGGGKVDLESPAGWQVKLSARKNGYTLSGVTMKPKQMPAAAEAVAVELRKQFPELREK